MQLTFDAVSEARPGPKWQALFQRYWPAYRQWLLQRRSPQQPTPTAARRALKKTMPELVPTYDRLLHLAGDDPLAAVLLSCYRPPAYLVSCSQAALARDAQPILVRNYDLDPNLNEGLILHSQWTGRKVIVSSEFLWGAADGINDAGLAVSLAFGGSRRTGDGFGIPLILRYLLEVCNDRDDAVAALQRIPSHMAYNVTVMDRQGRSATVQVGPDRPVQVLEPAIATNHQGDVEWPEHSRFTATVAREEYLRQQLADPHTDAATLADAFMHPPLYNTNYGQGFGTLYTAVYRPDCGEAEWRWPGEVWQQSLHDFQEGQREVHYSHAGAQVVNPDRRRAPVIPLQVPTSERHRRPDHHPRGHGRTAPTHPASLHDLIAAAPVAAGSTATWQQGWSTAPWSDAHTLAAIRTGLAAGGCRPTPALQAWFDHAEQQGRIPWETLGVVCRQGICAAVN